MGMIESGRERVSLRGQSDGQFTQFSHDGRRSAQAVRLTGLCTKNPDLYNKSGFVTKSPLFKNRDVYPEFQNTLN